ncbi:MAG: protein kinase [Planctomycetaceae bacterium]|nr:protein kinase [Planctomycetaceae bacterium]
MAGRNDTEIQSDDDRERSRRLSLQGNTPPATIEGYSIVRRLGTGAYGTVWLAREDRTGRMVAIKFYPHQRGLNWSMLSREVEKLAAVYTSHNIVRLLDVGWNAEPPYFVMEYVENGSLGSFLARGRLSVDDSVRIVREICNALIDAHGAGVLHCDLKPDNVLLDGQMHARLCDFGQARMSHEHSPALGTLYYMAPEQADLDALPDAKWDVYAVGALFYHLLTGSPPHRSEATQRQLEAADTLDERLKLYQKIICSNGPPVSHRKIKGVDGRLADIVDRCLNPIPSNRFPSAQGVRDALDERARIKSLRPLLLLGVLAPVLLMGAMLPIFMNAMHDNLRNALEQITTRALESDALSARLQAAALDHELRDRLEELENILADSELAEALEASLDRDSSALVGEVRQFEKDSASVPPRWLALLDAAWARSRVTNEAHDRGVDTSWFLNHRDGIQVWRREFSDVTLGKDFSYRDYFHGRGEDFETDRIPEDIEPLKRPYVCNAYKSTTTGRQTVALSVPVRNKVGEVIAVLSRSVHLGDLQVRMGRLIQQPDADSVQRVIALVESRDKEEWRLLDHPYLTESVIHAAESNNTDAAMLEKLSLDSSTVKAIQISQAKDRSSEVRLELYKDPVGGLPDSAAAVYQGDWLAAMAPVSDVGWMVIVQERRDAALVPVQFVAERASRQTWLSVLTTAVALMAVIWSFVWRAYSRG